MKFSVSTYFYVQIWQRLRLFGNDENEARDLRYDVLIEIFSNRTNLRGSFSYKMMSSVGNFINETNFNFKKKHNFAFIVHYIINEEQSKRFATRL